MEALQLQIEVRTDEEWENIASRPGLLGGRVGRPVGHNYLVDK